MPQSSRHRRGSAYVAACSGIVAWNAVSKTATCGTCGTARRASSIAVRAGPLCSGARSVSSASSRATASSIATGSRKRVPPWTTRWATATTSAGADSSDATGSLEPSGATADSLRLVDPALTTRTTLTRSVRPGPVADGGIVVAVLARVCAGAETRVLHLLAQPAGLARESRHAVDHIEHEVEPVEVVEHDHVERGGRRSLFLVAAHVQVRV